MWVFDGIQRAQTDRFQQFADSFLEFLVFCNQSVLDQGFGHNVLHDPARVQGRVRVLKNHLDTAAQGLATRSFEGGMRVLAVKTETAAGWLVQADQQFGNRAFAATRLTHQGQGFAFFDAERDTIDGFEVKPGFAFDHPVQPRRRDVERHGQVCGLNEGLARW